MLNFISTNLFTEQADEHSVYATICILCIVIPIKIWIRMACLNVENEIRLNYYPTGYNMWAGIM
jgi:hypothetical protein